MTSPGYPALHDPNDQRQPPLMPGDVLAGKYRMEDVVGAGAMGMVVRAWHVELEQPVAVKFLYPEYARNADGAERFRREARAAAKIKNQHVTRVLDVGTLEGKNVPYIVMEYLEGHDLAREIRELGPVQVAVAVRYIMQACEAVAEAHERGIVHRDLKPANLFVAEGAHGERMIKVLDFGISKVNGTGGAQQFSLTDTATLMGSPAYMSPEQLESSRNVDGRADIWSLGVILHELIMGQVPFTGESVPQLVRSILSGTRTSLVERDPALAGLEAVVARCLCQERAQRFDCIADLQEALRPFASLVLPGDPSLSMMASRQLPIPLLHGASGIPSLAGSMGGGLSVDERAAISGTAPVLQSQEARGTNGVASAWGNTQRGRHRSWQRHGVPLALLLALIGLGAYWVSDQLSSAPPIVPTEGHLANSPASARPGSQASSSQASSAQASGAQQSAAVPLPVPGEAGASPAESATHERSGGAGSDPRAEAAAAGPGGAAELSVQGAAPATPLATPPANVAKSVPVTQALAAPKVTVLPAAAPATDKPSSPARAADATRTSAGSVRAVPRAADGDTGDKPKSDTSSRSIPEVPDFGGRE